MAWLGGLSIGLICVPASIVLWPERGPALVGPEGTAEEGTSHALFVVVDLVALPMMLLAGIGAVISLLVRFRRARGDERQQIKWFAAAAALTLVWYLVFGQYTRGLPGVIVALASLLILQTIPVATGIAILRYRLYDIDRIINRTLVYGSLTAMLAVVFLGGVATTQALLRTLTGQEKLPQLVIVASTLVIAALFNPLRRRIQSFIDRSFYRKKFDARKTLETFSLKLRGETDLEALNNDLVGVVRETMQPTHVSLWLRPDTVPKGEHPH